ncbi:Zinc-binding dehydrogenase [Raoultella terrigena]|uniref:Zinc-binding dehydrogenase n=1 Tax=Raoultella terrigena TaxID=577 RepID=A0A4U9D6V5_RAOTE|nr:Zinc-binding dehydrogenase [Raoultella terrigena]
MPAGLKTIAVTHSADKHALARQLGANHVVANGKALREMGGADVLLVTTNHFNAAEDALTGLRADGRVVLCGLILTGRSRSLPKACRFT